MLWWTYQQLRSSSLKTRLAAVAKLAESRHADSVAPLLFALKDALAEIRSSAALALAQFQDPRAVEPLIKLIRDPVPLVRVTVVLALGQFNDERAINQLVSLLRDPDAAVRLQAVRSLDRLGWHPADEAARTVYVLATGNLGDMAELGADGIPALAEMLNSGTPEKQLSAVKALRDISDPRISRLMQHALTKTNGMVRIVALETLAELADPSAYEAVERLFKDSASNIRAAAVATAIRCGGQRAGPLLGPMLRDTSWEVRLETVKALGRIGDAAAIEGLCRALQDQDHDVRESAASALGKLGDARAIQPLVLTLMDLQSFVRTAAHNALFRIDRDWKKSDAARSALPQIKTARNHREYWISHSAEKLLEQIQSESENADTGWTPSSPARATGAASQPETTVAHPAFAILAELLRDPDRDLRLAAAEALGDLRETKATSQLLTASRDKDALVRQAAERALAAFS